VKREDLEHFKRLLLEERLRVLEELGWVEENYIGKSARDSTGSGSLHSVHPAELASDSMEMEKAYLIGSSSGSVLEDIDEALGDIEAGRYGRCPECGGEISRERLEAIPYARLCRDCKAKAEGSRGAGR
jgi:RNA polymerase-binding transcription factor DksA